MTPVPVPPVTPVSTVTPPSFSTPPKLRTVEEVLSEHPGTDVVGLRELAIAFTKECIYGKEPLIQCSLSGKKNTATLDKEKMDYIKMAAQSRVSNKPAVEFKYYWSLCQLSISKSCQTLSNARGKL